MCVAYFKLPPSPACSHLHAPPSKANNEAAVVGVVALAKPVKRPSSVVPSNNLQQQQQQLGKPVATTMAIIQLKCTKFVAHFPCRCKVNVWAHI